VSQETVLNLVLSQLEDQREDLKALIQKVDALQTTLGTETHQLKMAQAKCENRWGIMGKVLTLGLPSTGLFAWISSWHQK
jgi:hypothetical protein